MRADHTVDYWLPLAVFGVFTAIEPYAPAGLYPVAYMGKIAAVTATLFFWREGLADIKPSRRVMLPAVAVGILIMLQWVIIDKLVPYPHLGSRVGFDPFASVPNRVLLTAFIIARLYGLVIVVPIIEEIFWRSFLVRYITNQDFRSVMVGTFSAASLWIVSIGSALTHPEWLVALIAALLFAWLLRSTRSLFAAVLAHAVANAALGAYILIAKDWQYW